MEQLELYSFAMAPFKSHWWVNANTSVHVKNPTLMRLRTSTRLVLSTRGNSTSPVLHSPICATTFGNDVELATHLQHRMYVHLLTESESIDLSKQNSVMTSVDILSADHRVLFI
jgi:hypothetical protein